MAKRRISGEAPFMYVEPKEIGKLYGPYVRVKESLLCNTTLSPTAKLVYCMINRYRRNSPSDPLYRFCIVSQETLASQLRVHRNTVSKAKKELLNNGFLFQHRFKTGQKISYQFTLSTLPGDKAHTITGIFMEGPLPCSLKEFIICLLPYISISEHGDILNQNHTELARLTGYSRKSVIGYLRELEQSGFVVRGATGYLMRLDGIMAGVSCKMLDLLVGK